MIVENEGIRNQCEDCLGALVIVNVPYEGIGCIAGNLPYMYCERCDLYYICYDDGDEDGH